MSSASPIVVVFAKYPEPGRVKTRLIGPLTAEQAADVHRRCLQMTLDTVVMVESADLLLAVSPDEADFSTFVRDGVEIRPQGEGDLGERLVRQIENAFGGESRHVVVVGSDCPTMSTQDVRQAFDFLRRYDAVIGPAVDGGYYLLGLRKPARVLFDGIDWSTSRVLSQTLARAEDAGLSVAMLPERRDVDEFGDIMAIAQEIPDDEPRLQAFKVFLRALIQDGDNRE
ncbi:MAG: TIGR04282 family arsenosugar biosynthesis glycosyltransferase [Phycisphaerales bacterium]|nr:TIGR04282 family arsenosugar biosynthesis glycosyltransferase [Phycisphaerales bacterium]